MSVEPPSSGRPTGPPSGPLSGPSQPPAGPPSQPPSDTGGGAPGPEPHHPWWRSVPRIASLTAVVVAAVLVAVVLSRGGGGGSGTAQSGEVFLQAASSTGPDPFTESTAKDSTAPPVSPSPATESAPSNAVRGVDGGAPGLYSGSRNVGACDVEKQITYLQQAPAENRAFASVARIGTSDVASYLRSLTPVQLRMDTRVTNHGYRDGAVTSYQAVLQAGTAVFVDDRGVPRLRCACGNPLTTPVAQHGTPKRTGDSWPSYRPTNVVVVSASTIVVKTFVIYDPDRKEWLARPRGDDGRKDKKTEPPAKPSPSVSVSTPTSPTSPSTSISPSSPSPSDERRKEEPTTTAPTTTEPTTTEPTTTESTTKSESPETSPTESPSTTGTTTSQSASQSESQSAPTTGASQSPSL
ncbi:hypothetical protein EJ357_44410 [Streptomyces cyaneochromogenes]|uniref:DUF6777 domain-containing protein n=1 Tax=Streptomyces cyaneochromogenes TaxID=2496836 RepID=A0A3S9MK81_9ACTN|nr:DUF6777 domain-containing protein [Streptomyces cyaneochromogenes]AZQ39608.1 hypothetical protein EJ357_44410 [Streptomyces cyaneochromogenes]